jgi:hypothetical protein
MPWRITQERTPCLHVPVCRHQVEARREIVPSSWPLAVSRASWTPVSRALAGGWLGLPDDLPPGTGALDSHHRLQHLAAGEQEHTGANANDMQAQPLLMSGMWLRQR